MSGDIMETFEISDILRRFNHIESNFKMISKTIKTDKLNEIKTLFDKFQRKCFKGKLPSGKIWDYFIIADLRVQLNKEKRPGVISFTLHGSYSSKLEIELKKDEVIEYFNKKYSNYINKLKSYIENDFNQKFKNHYSTINLYLDAFEHITRSYIENLVYPSRLNDTLRDLRNSCKIDNNAKVIIELLKSYEDERLNSFEHNLDLKFTDSLNKLLEI